MIQTIKKAAVTLALMFLMTGCQAMTGETAGQNIDDGVLTSSVKTQLAGERVTPCHVWESRPTTGLWSLPAKSRPASEKSRAGTVASQVKGVRQVVNNLQVIKR